MFIEEPELDYEIVSNPALDYKKDYWSKDGREVLLWC